MATLFPVISNRQAVLKQEESLPFSNTKDFPVFTEQFADLRVLRYQVPGFDQLSLKQKTLCYYLYEAALSGRDIFYDQLYKDNLMVRKTLEAIINSGKADTTSGDWTKFMIYTKRVWFSNGIHHHYSSNKFIPECSEVWFKEQLKKCDKSLLPVIIGQSADDFIKNIVSIIFDPKVAPKRTNLDPNSDFVQTSAVNFYEDVTQKEASDFYSKMAANKSPEPPSFGLNTKLLKESNEFQEKQWKEGGMYSPAIEKIIYWLKKAEPFAESEHQKKVIDLLIQFYQSGDLKKFDEYSIEWAKDTSVVDFVNGFIEVYHDPLGYKGSWESYVSIKDLEATKRIKAIGDQAQWFEDHSSIMPQHKKKNVKGISAKVINVLVEGGDLAPVTAIGINLPNAEWIREEYGSKSVSIDNITKAYSEDGKASGVLEEFYYSDTIKDRLTKYGALADNLHTDMHEVIGHGSGQINSGVGSFNETLKNYSNTLEEARADLVALYYIMDPKLIEIGVMPSLEVGKAEYDRQINNGLMIQLTRLPEHENQVEEAHMRNRQMIAQWVYQYGQPENVISKVMKNGKTYFVINDYSKLRDLYGQLLREVQRIKSEGDYNAGSALVENYGVKVDPALHKEVLDRYTKLGIAPYRGFIQPKLVPVMNGNSVSDVKIEYPMNFTQQMLEYGKEYSFLPVVN
ncbi:MAG: dihydrofolate reductase [Chitinophagales bacterium]|nr:dihydrofolate reductase [Chitinophagales bacterium]